MKCRVCDQSDFSEVLDLGLQPWGNHFLSEDELGSEPKYPLRVVYCNKCSTAQLDYTVKKEVMFTDHTYLSGMASTLIHHFDEIAKNVDKQFFAEKSSKKILDIGSNDGTQLKSYQNLGYNVLGIDSCKKAAKIANENGVNTLCKFFNESLAKKIDQKFDVINAAGVFFHLEELHSVTRGIKHLLADKGVFVIQCIYMKSIVDNGAFDQIYHEHLLFYNIETLDFLLKKHGLALFDVEISPIHGGSLIAYATHADKAVPSLRLFALQQKEKESGCNTLSYYQKFAQKVEESKKRNLDFLEKCKKEGKVVYGMGAPVKGNTLLNYFGIGKNYLSALIEKNPLRKNLFSPGTHLPIWLEEELTSFPDVYYVLAWNFKKEILKKNQSLIEKGVEFFFPIQIGGES